MLPKELSPEMGPREEICLVLFFVNLLLFFLLFSLSSPAFSMLSLVWYRPLHSVLVLHFVTCISSFALVHLFHSKALGKGNG